MRYRPLDANGDYTVGVPWLVNSPATVEQAIRTRLKLWEGEFFLNTADGTPWFSKILGPRATRNPDAAIRQRILGTPGVTGLTGYSSTYTPKTRTLPVQAQVQTNYSTTPINLSVSLQG